MGKEIAGSKRIAEPVKVKTQYLTKAKLQDELAKQWSSSQGVVSKLELSEDGYAIVIVRTKFTDTTILCRGLANEANTYAYLSKILQQKGLISNKGNPGAFFLRKGFVWETVNPQKDTFRSGNCVMLVVNHGLYKVKKTIKHNDKRKISKADSVY